MRHVQAKLSLLVFLVLLVFHGASGAFSRDTKEYQSYQEKLKQIQDGVIQCRPSANLWTCQDSYGNEYNNLKIIKAN